MGGREVAFSATVVLLLAISVHALFPTIYEHDSKNIIEVKQKLQKMNVRKLFENAETSSHMEYEQEPRRTKRASGFGGPTCQAGWTGASCEFPICGAANHHDHGIPSADRQYIDMFYARRATDFFYIYVDNTMHGQELQVESDNGDPINPMLTLIDANGTIYTPENQENSPTNAIYTYNYLPVGTYKVQLNADNPMGSMLLMYNAVTYLSTEIGGITYEFLDDFALHSDTPNYTFYVNTPTVFVASPVGLDSPGSLATVSFFSDNVPAPHNLRLDLRYGCHYLYYTNAFTCGRDGHFFARVRGYDFFGHSFTRLHAFVCEIPPLTTPRPTTSTTASTGTPGPLNCFHGGAPISRVNGTAYCYCPPGRYTGPYCGTPLCMNNGEARGQVCNCPSGFSGSHCQNVICSDVNETPGAGTRVGTPILTFVVRARASMNSIISQVSGAVSQIVTDLAYDPPYISQFGLIVYNNNDSSNFFFSTPNDLITKLNSLATSTDTSGGCSDIAFESVYDALSRFMITNKSPIYVITDAEPYDSEDYIESIFQRNSFFQAPIHFFFIQAPANSGCQNMDFNSHPFVEMGTISRRFSGLATYVTTDMQASFQNFLYTHLSHTYHKAHLVFSDDQYQCENLPRFIPVSVDAQFHEIVFITEGDISDIQLNTPEGNVAPYSGNLVYGGLHMYWLTGVEIGTWTVSIIPSTNRSACYVRVYAVESPEPQLVGQDYHLVYAITPSLNLDAPEYQPMVGIRQSIVAHIENYPLSDPSALNAEIIVFTDGGSNSRGRNFVMASNGIWRDGCSYEIYFPPFYCFDEGLNLYFSIFVRDAIGNTIQRAGVFYCASVHPTTPPPPGTCANGGIYYNGTCICPTGWSGNQCQTRVCFNNGTLSGAGYCQCPPGTGGEWCQLLRCITPNNRPGFGMNARHMVFILDVTKNNAPALTDMATHIAEIVRDIASQEPNWISQYFVIGADSQKVYNIGRTGTDNLGHVQDFFNTALQLSSNSTDTSCNSKIFEAIMESMRFFNDRSYINVFTSTAPDESGALNTTLPAYNAILRGQHLLNVFAASRAPNNFSCGQPINYQILSDLADVTTGRLLAIMKTEFFLAMKLIPTWYSSSMIYRKFFPDCSKNATIFAPIDSYTQSIQIYVNGQNAGNSGFVVTIPDGTEFDNSRIGAIVSDNNNGIGIYDLRRPCDEGWEPMSDSAVTPYCFVAQYQKISWDDARAWCSNAGGFLVDDLTQTKDSWLSTYTGNRAIWLGLNSYNGSYHWDRGMGKPQDNMNGSTYSNWYNGDNSVDPNQPCVYRDTEGFWRKSACNVQTFFFVCQKHLYSSEYEPNTLDDDDLPGGRWMFSFQGAGSCSLEIRVQSSIMVYSGFVTHLLEDYPTSAGVSASTDNRIISHMQGISSPNHIPFLRYAHVMDPVNGTIYQAATYQYRANCAFEYLSQTFTCPNTSSITNRFEVMHVGEDEFGLPFQRVTSSVCEPPRDTCNNFGLVYNGQCVCDEYWQGQYCEVPICVNGGLLNSADNTCQCPIGFVGRACQYDVCFPNPNAPNVTFSPDNKALVIVIEATTQNSVGVADLGSKLNGILTMVPTTYFSTYVLVTFDANGVTNTQTSTNINDFVSKYNSATSSLSSNNNCDLPLFTAATAALNAATIPSNSIIYLITTGGSSPADQQKITDYWNVASNSASPLFYLLVKSVNCSVEVSSPNSMIVTDIAIGTDGNILEISNTNVGKIVSQHLPSLYNGTVAGTPTLQNNTYSCQNLTFYLPIGQAVQKAWLYVWSTTGYPTVVGPDGQNVTISTDYIDQNSVFYYFTPSKQGYYTININDPGICMLQARIQGGAEIYPGYISVPDSNPGIGSHLDNATAVPQVGTNILVASVLNDMVELQYASLYSPHRSSGEIQYIQMYYRGECNYNYYSDPFTCDEGGYFITFYGIGSGGQPFFRASYTKCAGFNLNMTSTVSPPSTSPTTPITGPPVTNTVPTAQTTTSYGYPSVKADVVLILDGSTDVTPSQINDITNALVNAFQQFTISKDYLNMAIIVALGDNFPVALVKNTFTSIYTTQGLKNALKTAYDNSEWDSGSGQSMTLSMAVQQLYNPNFIGIGYRNSTQNHLAIYVTSTNSPNQDAINNASTVMQQNLFRFMAFGYHGTSNQAALTQFVGGTQACAVVTIDPSQITKNIVDKIWMADSNGGNYC